MNILFLHPNMPGQYKYLAGACAAEPGNRVVFLTEEGKPDVRGVTKVEYRCSRVVSPEVHDYLRNLSRDVFRSQEVWRVCKRLRDDGFVPDVIVGHLGWGIGLFLPEIFPDVPLLNYAEYYFRGRGPERGFLDESDNGPEAQARQRLVNSANLFSLTEATWNVTPTFFQRDVHPPLFHGRMSVLHDGIDTVAACPDAEASWTLDDGTRLTRDDEVLTYVSPTFEPFRGFPQFMRAAERIQRERPRCHILVVGRERGGGYGSRPGPNETTCLQRMLDEVTLDRSRFHLLGALPHRKMVRVLQLSRVHIYLTAPYVLSWSLLEAMACGCLVIGSDTAPVREVIEDGRNGLLLDFFADAEFAERACEVLVDPAPTAALREAARATVLRHYALDRVLPLHRQLIDDLAAGNVPPPAAAAIEVFHDG